MAAAGAGLPPGWEAVPSGDEFYYWNRSRLRACACVHARWRAARRGADACVLPVPVVPGTRRWQPSARAAGRASGALPGTRARHADETAVRVRVPPAQDHQRDNMGEACRQAAATRCACVSNRLRVQTCVRVLCAGRDVCGRDCAA
jgi:hypothetical protein